MTDKAEPPIEKYTKLEEGNGLDDVRNVCCAHSSTLKMAVRSAEVLLSVVSIATAAAACMNLYQDSISRIIALSQLD